MGSNSGYHETRHVRGDDAWGVSLSAADMDVFRAKREALAAKLYGQELVPTVEVDLTIVNAKLNEFKTTLAIAERDHTRMLSVRGYTEGKYRERQEQYIRDLKERVLLFESAQALLGTLGPMAKTRIHKHKMDPVQIPNEKHSASVWTTTAPALQGGLVMSSGSGAYTATQPRTAAVSTPDVSGRPGTTRAPKCPVHKVRMTYDSATETWVCQTTTGGIKCNAVAHPRAKALESLRTYRHTGTVALLAAEVVTQDGQKGTAIYLHLPTIGMVVDVTEYVDVDGVGDPVKVDPKDASAVLRLKFDKIDFAQGTM